jgi:hypothetical protein
VAALCSNNSCKGIRRDINNKHKRGNKLAIDTQRKAESIRRNKITDGSGNNSSKKK